MRTKKCILLVRVSTEAQSYDAQEKELFDLAMRDGYKEKQITPIAYKESGIKLKEEERLGIQKMYDLIDTGEYESVYAWEISRIARTKKVLFSVQDRLVKNHIQLIIKNPYVKLLKENGDIDEGAELIFTMYAQLAEAEMRNKKVRFARGKKEWNEKGFSIVGKVLFGYSRVRDESVGKNKFVVNEKEAQEIKDIYNTYLYGLDGKDIGIKGLTFYAIQKGMSPYLHSKRNMTKMLSEAAYVGGVKEVRTKKKNPAYWEMNDHTKDPYVETVSHIPYPAIVSKAQYDAVQRKKKENRIIVDKSKKHLTILAKLIECPDCHTFLIADYRKGRMSASYRCAKHKAGKCKNSSIISMPYIDSLVWCYLKQNVKQIIEEIYKKDYDVSISNIESEISNCQRKKKSLQEDVKSFGVIFKNEVRIFGIEEATKKYDKSVEKIKSQIDELDAMIEAHKKKILDIKNISSTELTDEDMERVEGNKEKISEYIHLLVHKILCTNTKNYTFVRVILNGDNDRTFRGILANKRDTNRIQAYGIKKDKTLPISIINKERKDDNGDVEEWVESGMETMEKLILMDEDLELYPLDFKKLQVYNEY